MNANLLRALRTCLIWACVAVVTFPLFWMFSTALRPEAELFRRPPELLPQHWTLQSFRKLLTETDFLLFFKNSAIVASVTTLIVLVVATIGAHAIVTLKFRGHRLVSQAVLFTYLLPTAVLLIPIYLIISKLGLTNTLLSLIIAYTSFMLPFALWLMRSFLSGIPAEIEAAARIDGASRMQAFVDVVLPQAVPGLITTGVFAFILSWNEYLYSLVLISEPSKRTLSTGVMTSLVDAYSIEWNLVMAASVMMSLPLIIIFILLQRYIMGGLGAGSVKG